MLRTEIVEISGRKIEVKEMSVLDKMSALELAETKNKILTTDALKICIKKEDLDFLGTVSDDNALAKLIEALNKVNRWGKFAEGDEFNPLQKKPEN